jgi:hypothetical protein
MTKRTYTVTLSNPYVERYNGVNTFDVYDVSGNDSCVYINGITGCSKNMVKASILNYMIAEGEDSDLENLKKFLSESSTTIVN